jgi:hypothetical protein
MDLTEKIMDALQHSLGAEYIRLDNDDGISGFVVSPQFESISGIDRQRLIDEALRNAADPLSAEEQRQILMIAGLTPLEYESVGTRIRVRRIKELEDGSLEVLLRGSYSDAVYVQSALRSQKDVTITEPEPNREATGTQMKFRARGTEANPLTKEKAISALKADRYIAVANNA